MSFRTRLHNCLGIDLLIISLRPVRDLYEVVLHIIKGNMINEHNDRFGRIRYVLSEDFTYEERFFLT